MIGPLAGAGARLLLATAALAAGSPTLHAARVQDDDATAPVLPRGSEGPLANNAFLPVVAGEDRIAAELRAGDEALERARREATAGNERDAERRRVEAFEAWRETLAASDAFASIWSDGDGARRLTTGLFHALAGRLARLTDEERAQWSTRFFAPSQAALARARASIDTAALARVAWEFPGTDAAVTATVLLADLDAERGRRASALAWLERASDAVELQSRDASTARAAIDARRDALRAATNAGPAPEAWRTATELSAASGPIEIPNELALFSNRRARPLDPSEGARPGLVFYRSGPGGRVAVQTWDRVLLYSVAADSKLEAVGRFDPPALLSFDIEFDPFESMRAPGWPFLPLADDGDLILVHGRSSHGRGNALLRVRPADGRGLSLVSGAAPSATLEWAVVGAMLVRPNAPATAIPELADLVDLEYQPGPVLSGDHVVAQAREEGGETRAWLVAFDRATGAFAWKLLIATGSDLVPDLGRGSAGAPRLSAEPLAARDGLVFAGTNLGIGALVESLDGRPVWSVRTRRRAVDDAGWLPSRPLFGAEAVLWGPFDSDRLYALRPTPVDATASGTSAAPRLPIFAGPVRSRGESTALVSGPRAAGDALTAVVQGRSGRERTVSVRGAPGSARLDALYLGPDEDFRGRGLASDERVLCSTNRGVYLFDRTRDLYLADYAALAGADPKTSGGDVYADASTVIVLGRDGLWSFRAR